MESRMKSTINPKITMMVPYMEVVGPFSQLQEQDGVLLAEIAGHIVLLPDELKDALTPHIGSRIAILRTDIPGKEYVFRVLTTIDLDIDVKPAAMAGQNEDE
jgi:hypothetical protein